jgi:hypothetical protein
VFSRLLSDDEVPVNKILIALCLGLSAAYAQEVPQASHEPQNSTQHGMAGMNMDMDERANFQLPSPTKPPERHGSQPR